MSVGEFRFYFKRVRLNSTEEINNESQKGLMRHIRLAYYMAISARIFFVLVVAVHLMLSIMAQSEKIRSNESGWFYVFVQFMTPNGMVFLLCLAFFLSILSRLLICNRSLPMIFFSLSAMILIGVGVIYFTLGDWFSFEAAIGGAFGGGIAVYILSFRYRPLRLWSILAIVVLVIPALYFGVTTLNCIFGHLYTPPSIDSKKLPVYKQCVTLLERYKNISFNGYLIFQIGENRYVGDNPNFEIELLGEGVSHQDIDAIKTILSDLEKIRCRQVIRKEGMVFFLYPKNYIFSSRLGVLYSINGKNPNEVNSEFLKERKPFANIGGNWYVSRNLPDCMGHRTRTQQPQWSLIDCSLTTPGVSKAELILN